MKMKFQCLINSLISKNILVVLFWILLTAININKAYHIDDTFHLEAAESIKQHPLKPMSGSINWRNSPTPMFEYNQPPLFFYIIAFAQIILGDSEISMHLLLSIFTFLSLYFFNKLSEFLHVKQKKTLLTIFAFCPAFIINQNLMTDVPILALSLGIIYYLLKGQEEGTFKNYIISATLLCAGLLIKYSLLPVLLVVFISILLSGDYKKIVVLFIPLTGLVLWSIWNIIEFDSIHILGRSKPEFNINKLYSFMKKLYSFMGILGSMATFSFVFFYSLYQKKITQYLIILGFFVFILSAFLVYYSFINETNFTRYINYFFTCNGLLLMLLIVRNVIKSLFIEKQDYFKSNNFTFALFILGISAFIILFSPFNATRHVLLIIPFILLFGHKLFETSHGTINNLVLCATISLGILLGISDWVYADFYRKSAKEIVIADKTVWSLGHWGWQWYSRKNGMIIYSKDNEVNVRNGDIIVYPKDVSKQKISPYIDLETINYISQESNFFTFFSGKNYASMYISSVYKPAWTLSNSPIDTIVVSKVKKEIGVSDIIDRINSDDKLLNSVRNKAINRGVSLDSMLILDAEWIISQKRNE